VLDDWGLVPFTTTEGRELFEVDDRCQTKSTVVASQAPVDKWQELMPDSTVADALWVGWCRTPISSSCGVRLYGKPLSAVRKRVRLEPAGLVCYR
jgi:hypothetical protein